MDTVRRVSTEELISAAELGSLYQISKISMQIVRMRRKNDWMTYFCHHCAQYAVEIQLRL
jgi:hypothetical protein